MSTDIASVRAIQGPREKVRQMRRGRLCVLVIGMAFFWHVSFPCFDLTLY